MPQCFKHPIFILMNFIVHRAQVHIKLFLVLNSIRTNSLTSKLKNLIKDELGLEKNKT